MKKALIWFGIVAFASALLMFWTYKQDKAIQTYLQSTNQGQLYLKIKQAGYLTFPIGTVAVEESGKITVLTDEKLFPNFPPNERIDHKMMVGNITFYPTQVIEREAAERDYLLELSKNRQHAPQHWRRNIKYIPD